MITLDPIIEAIGYGMVGAIVVFIFIGPLWWRPPFDDNDD